MSVLAVNPQDSGSMQVVASPTFRVMVGRSGTLNLGDAAGGIKIVATPSDLGQGRVALHVVTEVRNGARVQRSTFDVLTGAGVSAATVAPRDATGAFLMDGRGYPVFVEFIKVIPVAR